MGAKSVSSKLKDVKLLYQQWLRCPDDMAKERNGFADCKTRREFAKKYNVNRTTLYRWEQDPEFMREVTAPISELVTPDDIAVALRAVVAKAREGNVGAFKEIARIYGLKAQTPEESEEDASDSEFFEKASKEELKAYLESLETEEIESGA